ncbi:MAG: hypothetical protein SVK08_00025 [Halobacteriota archaeon]|nr:hypothetical protein [Halobacteriota archaeon]
MYQVKNLKSFPGMEWDGWTASLYRDGKKIGIVTDYGNGGEINIDISQEELAMIIGHCESLPKEEMMGMSLSVTPDVFLGGLADNYEIERSIRKIIREKKTAVLIKEENGKETLYEFGAPYSPGLAKKIREKHGDKVVEIANEREEYEGSTAKK